jgi:hypothetical protein
MVRLLGLAPAALLLSGLLAVWAGPLAAPVAATAPTGTVVAWGDNGDGQTTVPTAALSGVTAIAAGGGFSLALKSDGTVVAWGDNGDGQTTVPAGLSGVTAIAAGDYHSLALKSDGTVVAWGDNGDGQATLPAGLSGVIAIAAGDYHSLALKSDGTVVAWGNNFYGQTTVPIAASSGVTAIAAGAFHSLALLSNGAVVAWGYNAQGQTTVPIAASSGVTAIAAGANYSLALKSNGTVVAWGDNTYGQTTIPAGLSGVTAIAAAGGFHSLALLSDGTVVAWGYNLNGQTTVPAGLSGVTAIAAGSYHSLALVPPPHLIVSGIVSPYPAGAAHSVTVTAKDAYGNIATGYTGTVHFTSSDPKAVLPADYTFTGADAGTHMFSLGVILKTAGSQWVRATDKTTASITGAQKVTVTPGVAKTLSVGTLNPYPAGATHSVTVKAYDAYGNVATGYLGTIHFTSSDTHATLPADYTFIAGDKGAHTFPNTLIPGLTLKTAGSQWVRATDKTTASITGAQTVNVTPGSAKTLSVGTFNPYPAGVSHSVTVKALDAYGNVATGYHGSIHFTSSDTHAVLPADYTFTAGDAGVHTFTGGLVLKTAGSQWVRATDKTTASIAGSQTVSVTPGAAKTLSVGTFNPYPAGVSHSVTVKALDAYGNVATGYHGSIHFTSSDTHAVLPADYTFTAGDAGVHTFTGGLVLKTAGSQWVRATDKTTASITGAQTVSVT